MLEAVYTSETSVYFNKTTWHYIPEGCHLHKLWILLLEEGEWSASHYSHLILRERAFTIHQIGGRWAAELL
jgi:hypothetical protein